MMHIATNPFVKPEPQASDKIPVSAPLSLDTSEKIPATHPRNSPSDAPQVVVPKAEKIPVDSAQPSPVDAPQVLPPTEKELRCSPVDAPEAVPEPGLEVGSPAAQTRRTSLRADWTAAEDTVIRGRFAQALRERLVRSEDEIWFTGASGRELFKCRDRWVPDGSVGWLDAKGKLLYTIYIGRRWAGVYDQTSKQQALLRWRKAGPGRSADLKLYVGTGDVDVAAPPDMVLEAREGAHRAQAALKIGDEVVGVLDRTPFAKEAFECQVRAGVDTCMACMMAATLTYVMKEIDQELLLDACDDVYGKRGSLKKWFREHKRLT